jgi:hypothetical protein
MSTRLRQKRQITCPQIVRSLDFLYSASSSYHATSKALNLVDLSTTGEL